MTSDNKPSWQYTPPSTAAESDVVDATRFMKGAPRHAQNDDTAQASDSNTPVISTDMNKESFEPVAETPVLKDPVEAASVPPTEDAQASPTPESAPMAHSIDYDTHQPPAATEYSAPASHDSRPPERSFDRPQRSYNNGRSEGFQGRPDGEQGARQGAGRPDPEGE